MSNIVVELFGKPGCHLCDDARAVITSVVQDFPGAELRERSILDDPELFESMKNDIPVVSVNGTPVARWRIDSTDLRRELEGALS